MSEFRGVVAYRGDIVEDRHRVSVAVVDATGKLLFRHGDPARPTLLRSTSKPFQVQPLLLGEGVERFAIGDEDIALACASHTGAHAHTERVLALLFRIGLAESDLGCGAHSPAEPVASELARAGREPSAVHNNCSGKHAAMLAASLARGWPTSGYLAHEHPLQQEIRVILAELSGVSGFPSAIDGCSAPTYALPLNAMARMFALLLDPAAAPAPLRPGLARAATAMRRFPELVGGDGVVDTFLMRRLPLFVAKRGAAAAYTMAASTPAHGVLGIALKVEDGSAEARDCAIHQVLAHLDVDGFDAPEVDAFLRPERRNCRGLKVGRMAAEFDLERA